MTSRSDSAKESAKTCVKCGALKPLSAFHARPGAPDGRRAECGACRCRYQQQYARSPSGRDVQHRADRVRNERFPERRYARTTVFYAIERGEIVPQPCFVCGAEAEAHHADYSRPLDVVWLCVTHHRQAHLLAKEAA